MLLLSRLKTKVIFDFQEELIRRTFLVSFSSLILVLTLPLGGCTKPKATIQGNINCGGGKPCTYGGSASMTFAVHAEEVSPADLNIALATGYAVVVSVPSNELALDPEAVPQATLTATTDTGYSSSILVNTTLTGSAPSTLVSGYTDYTFEIPVNAALSTWVDSVNANTTNTSAVVSAASTTFKPIGIEGTYTVYTTISSLQTSATFHDPGFSPKGQGGCKPGYHCTQ